MDRRLEFIFDENLRDVPCDPNGLREYTNELGSSLLSTIEPKKRARILGEIGVHLRCLGDLDSAEGRLLESLKIIKDNHLGVKQEVQQKIRLAHTLQWKKDFNQSNLLFDEVLTLCRSCKEAGDYLDFALQHAGKNFFDQGEYRKALGYFSEAMVLRNSRQAPSDQIESTALAINRTKVLLGE